MMKQKFTMLPASEQDKSKTVTFHDDEKNGVTVCRLYDRWNDRYFTAKTRVHDVDQYDKMKGRAIAFNKARRKELLNDLAGIEADRAYITERFEELMNKLDQREGLKHIYLMGVEDELRELMYGVTDMGEEPVEMEEPTDECETTDTCDFAASENNLKDVEKDAKKKKSVDNIKLTQFA